MSFKSRISGGCVTQIEFAAPPPARFAGLVPGGGRGCFLDPKMSEFFKFHGPRLPFWVLHCFSARFCQDLHFLNEHLRIPPGIPKATVAPAGALGVDRGWISRYISPAENDGISRVFTAPRSNFTYCNKLCGRLQNIVLSFYTTFIFHLTCKNHVGISESTRPRHCDDNHTPTHY